VGGKSLLRRRSGFSESSAKSAISTYSAKQVTGTILLLVAFALIIVWKYLRLKFFG
jgi:hypothetical protein